MAQTEISVSPIDKNLQERTDREYPFGEEGPQQKIRVNLDITAYRTAIHPDKWFYDSILAALMEQSTADNVLVKAIKLSQQEHFVRPEYARGVSSAGEQKTIIPGAEEYAFRIYFRRSDGKPLENQSVPSGRATRLQAENSLYEHGIESPKTESAAFLLPGRLWFAFFDPEMINPEEDLMTISVYKNTAFIAPKQNYESNNVYFLHNGAVSTDEQDLVTLIDIDKPIHSGRIQKITREEAQRYPRMRDVFLGSIEVQWRQTEKTQGNSQARQTVISNVLGNVTRE